MKKIRSIYRKQPLLSLGVLMGVLLPGVFTISTSALVSVGTSSSNRIIVATGEGQLPASGWLAVGALTFMVLLMIFILIMRRRGY